MSIYWNFFFGIVFRVWFLLQDAESIRKSSRFSDLDPVAIMGWLLIVCDYPRNLKIFVFVVSLLKLQVFYLCTCVKVLPLLECQHGNTFTQQYLKHLAIFCFYSRSVGTSWFL